MPMHRPLLAGLAALTFASLAAHARTSAPLDLSDRALLADLAGQNPHDVDQLALRERPAKRD